MPSERVHFEICDSGRAPADSLIEAMLVELEGLYGRVDGPGTPSASPADFAVPNGAFLVGWQAGQAVACGGIKQLDEHTAEIKRMYLVPEVRGRGLSRLLLGALEDEARRHGYRRVRLDTGRHQAAAIALYDGSGYTRIEDYNHNPHADYWAEKQL